MKKVNGKKTLSTLVVALMALVMIPVLAPNVKGATLTQINASGDAAVAYLASVQNPDGSWGGGLGGGDWPAVPKTGLVLLKFETRATELGLDPFDNDPNSPTYYQYANNVIAGMNYLLSMALIVSPLPIQVHGSNNDNPDSNGNGQGIRFTTSWEPVYPTYITGIALAALACSAHPNDRSYTIGGISYTYKQIAQDAVDYFAWGQGDHYYDLGGWSYGAIDNNVHVEDDQNHQDPWTDNSNTGYAVLGLSFAEAAPFSCTVPQWAKDNLKLWITKIQDTPETCPLWTPADDGGSMYNPNWDWWNPYVNCLKTGNLISEMAFCGYAPSTSSVQRAVAYLERHWRDPNLDPGWGYSMPVANYQAKFLIEKGLTFMGITELDTNGDGVKENWFNQEPPAAPPEDFASVIVSQQLLSGGWPQSSGVESGDPWPDAILSTAWAVLTLEQVAPHRVASIESCDFTGVDRDEFLTTENLYVKGKGYSPLTTYDLSVVNDVTWINGMTIPTRVPNTAPSITTDSSGNILTTAVWNLPLTPGKYDIIVDVNGNGKYDVGVDALDDLDISGAGFFVVPEYSVGTILGLIMCFAGVTVYKKFNKFYSKIQKLR